MNLKHKRIKTNNRLIAVSNENYTSLQSIGKLGMSFNDVITELLKKYGLQYDQGHIVKTS